MWIYHANKVHWCLAARAVVALVLALPVASAQDGGLGAPGFKFADVDNRLLEEVNEYSRQIEKKGLLFRDPGVESYVEGIGRKLVAGLPPIQDAEFRFRVLRDPMVNAFALPNGTIYVTTGLLSALANEAQLASVLGHESTHVINRHSYLENRSARKKALAINILQGVAASMPGSAFGAVVALGAAVSAGIVNYTIFGYSQEKEREADRYGFDLMIRASYDPNAMEQAFAILDERLEFEPVEGVYRTHPKLEERRKIALGRAGATSVKDAFMGDTNDYLGHVAPAICANIEADLNSRRARTAVARASRLTKWKPDDPRYQVLLANGYRALGAKSAEPNEEERGRHGQAEHRTLYFKMTEQEEQNRLLTGPEGAAVRDANLHEAEKLYHDALRLDANYAPAHREMGFLYEQESRLADAAREYRTYLDLTAGTSFDRVRIENRLSQIERKMPDTK